MSIPFMDKLRSFLGIAQEPPRNDFRNPIWGDDDDDDGDELYSRTHLEAYNGHEGLDVFTDPRDLQRDFAKQMHDMFLTFGTIFGDMKTFMHDFDNERVDSFTNTPMILPPSQPEKFDSNNIRDYYLKPGYHNHRHDKEDVDLDGKISSQDIAGLLKKRDEEGKPPATHFNSDLVPGRSFCRTIITTSITKPDGSRETKRIVKDGHAVVEETITTTEPDPRGLNVAMDSFSASNYSSIFADLGSIFRNFY